MHCSMHCMTTQRRVCSCCCREVSHSHLCREDTDCSSRFAYLKHCASRLYQRQPMGFEDKTAHNARPGRVGLTAGGNSRPKSTIRNAATAAQLTGSVMMWRPASRRSVPLSLTLHARRCHLVTRLGHTGGSAMSCMCCPPPCDEVQTRCRQEGSMQRQGHHSVTSLPNAPPTKLHRQQEGLTRGWT